MIYRWTSFDNYSLLLGRVYDSRIDGKKLRAGSSEIFEGKREENTVLFPDYFFENYEKKKGVAKCISHDYYEYYMHFNAFKKIKKHTGRDYFHMEILDKHPIPEFGLKEIVSVH